VYQRPHRALELIGERWGTFASSRGDQTRPRSLARLAETAAPAIPAVVSALAARPRAMAIAGALTIAFSAILVKQAGVSPSTAAIFRCAYALPVLGMLAWWEAKRLGPRSRRDRALAALAGVFFSVDLICWHHAIEDVGAGLATVLGNLQVAFVPLVAWLALGERPAARVLATLPLVLSGVVLISGVLEDGAYGANPTQGVIYGAATGLAYTGFILVLRAGSGELQRVAGPLFDATLVAAVAATVGGALIGDADLVPAWPAHAWLVILALSSQVLGWLLISASLPRLPAALTSLLLTIQPVGSVALGVVLFGEAPSALQLAGVAAILVGLVMVARVRPPPTEGI
jgi:drug/metabolite transporter (DMT)-like permease